MFSLLLARPARRSSFGESTRLRTEVMPPSLRHAPDCGWQRLLGWLIAPSVERSSPPLNRLPPVRGEFAACLVDVQTDGDEALRARIAAARSLRELWHLRAEVYRLVATAHSEAEAQARLARLNRHFPTRAPRSGFAPLQG